MKEVLTEGRAPAVCLEAESMVTGLVDTDISFEVEFNGSTPLIGAALSDLKLELEVESSCMS